MILDPFDAMFSKNNVSTNGKKKMKVANIWGQSIVYIWYVGLMILIMNVVTCDVFKFLTDFYSIVFFFN